MPDQDHLVERRVGPDVASDRTSDSRNRRADVDGRARRIDEDPELIPRRIAGEFCISLIVCNQALGLETRPCTNTTGIFPGSYGRLM